MTEAEREALETIKALQDPLYFASSILHQDLWSLYPRKHLPDQQWNLDGHLCSRKCFNQHKYDLAADGTFYAGQEDVLWSTYYRRQTAVKSCHGSGKTRVAAILVLAWMKLFPPGSALAITTSASWGQVESELWGDIRKMLPGSRWQFPKANLFEMRMPGGSQAFGMSTDEAVNFHGFHAEHVLLVIDEVSGISGEIMKAIKSIMAAGDVHVLYLMNPVESSGPSVDLFETQTGMMKFTIDGLTTPNMRGYHIFEDLEMNETDPDKAHNLLYLPDEPEDDCELDNDGGYMGGERFYLLRKRQVRDWFTEDLRLYGTLKPEAEWWPRVRGQFPKEQINQLIHRDWIIRAINNHESLRTKDIYVGIDVAGPGKAETAICVRQGMTIINQRSWGYEDCVSEIIKEIGDPNPRMTICVDSVAIGMGLCNELIHKGYNVVFCNAANKAIDTTRFYDAKAEWYWRLREMFQQGEIGCERTIDKLCCDQLQSIHWDRQNLRTLVRIEPKQAAAKRGVPSPDRAEALMLCFSAAPMMLSTGEVIYVKNDVQHGPAQQMIAPSPFGPDQPTDMPVKVDKWIQTMEARKRLKTGHVGGYSRATLEALAHPQPTVLYDSTGRVIGVRENALDPEDRRIIEGLMEPAD